MVKVLGIDPGSRATGWALVVAEGNHYHLDSAGVLRPRGAGREDRLADLQRRLVAVVEKTAPDCAAVESSFSGINPRSGIALAESRGAILAVLGGCGLAVCSYSPAQVKSAIVGHGRAEKRQVVYMVVRLLNLAEDPPHDAADAMAAALTHIHLGAGRLGR
ncbi:MAG: crossover junction endodeoxyribonuclease RuvC [Acidobacteriota bacterium]